MENKRRTIVITGGGTGGHLFPALAVAEALREMAPDVDLLYISRENIRDRSEVERRNIPFQGFKLSGLRRKISLKNILALWRFAAALIKCWFLLRRQSKGVVFGVGGYAAAPAMAAGKLAGWKLALHEQNSVPGLVNRVMASRCDSVFLTFDSTREYLSGVSTVTTGLPMRKELLEAMDSAPTDKKKDGPFVLIMGGSQGARKLVETGLKVLQKISERGVAFKALIQTGEKNYDWAVSLPKPDEVELTPFIENMAEVYKKTDIVVSRAGSGSLSEIALLGLPSILIPYPFASEDHQLINARGFLNTGAAYLIEEQDLTPERLGEYLSSLLQRDEERLAMGQCALSLAKRDAANTIAKELLRLLNI